MKVTPTSFIEKLEASKEKPKGTVVANIKSQKKRIITAEKARERNKAVRASVYVLRGRRVACCEAISSNSF